jgi:hypothetical protein
MCKVNLHLEDYECIMPPLKKYVECLTIYALQSPLPI